jgi:hypothetical protein
MPALQQMLEMLAATVLLGECSNPSLIFCYLAKEN